MSAAKLVATYRGLLARQNALQAQGEVGGDEGYALTDKKVDAEEAKKLSADFTAWKRAAWVNLWVSSQARLERSGREYKLTHSAWIPLTLHWSLGGLWVNPLITAAIGTVVSVGKLNNAWAAAA